MIPKNKIDAAIRIKLSTIDSMTLLNCIFDNNRVNNQFDPFREYVYQAVDCILGCGNPDWVLGTQSQWVGPPNLADVLGRTTYPKPSLGSQ
jgi:hypothetical protein